MTTFILALAELTRSGAGIAGSKAANLGDLLRAGFPVPEGFVLTTAAFERFLAANALGPDATPEAIRASQFPSDVESALRLAAAALDGAALAVRSSAVAEDLPGASFAGQYETVLGVRGPEAVCEAVKQCWASAFSARVATYRKAREPQEQPPRQTQDVLGRSPASETAAEPDTAPAAPATSAAMAVLVQRLIEADAAGVAFTANPVTGDRAELVVSAVRGLGDRLVSGQVTPDEWVVRDRPTGGSDGGAAGGGPDAVCLLAPEGAIDEHGARAVAALARRIEAHFGGPQDVEWTMRGGELFVVQARPITALPEPPPLAVGWQAPSPGGWARNFRFGEWLGDPITPLFETWLLPSLESAFWGALRRVADMPTPQPTYIVVNGWYFTSMNFWPSHTLAWFWQLARHPRLMRVLLQFVPALADRVLAPWVRKWRAAGLPQYRAVVQEAEAQVNGLGAEELLQLIDRVGAAAGDYFVWIALVAGAGYKTEAPLAQFYRKHVFPTVGGTHQQLLVGLAEPGLPAGAHAVHSLDWWHPTLGDFPIAEGAVRTGDRPPGASALDRPSPVSAAGERAAVEVRAALAHRPRRLKQFELLLATARRYAALREEIVSPFTLGWPVLRRAVQRLGDELVRAGALDARDGVFFLTHGEVIAALRAGNSDGLRERVIQRRREWEDRRRLVPPLRLGEMPLALKRGFDRLEAALAPDAAASGAVLRGLPASAGRATGPVRVLRGPAEFDRLQRGDVLVAPTTAPAWTPLFARAAAVVTDSGSVLAHTSLVAREYGIPAVVGTGDATARLRDGDVVLVDGDIGAVTNVRAATHGDLAPPPGDDEWPAPGDLPPQAFDVWTRSLLEEIWPHPVSPLTWSGIPSLQNDAFRKLVGVFAIPNLDQVRMFGRFYGRVYGNDGAMSRIMCDEIGLPAAMLERGTGLGAPRYRFPDRVRRARPLRLLRHLPGFVRLGGSRVGIGRKLEATFPQIDRWLAEFRARELDASNDRELWAGTAVWTGRLAPVLDLHNATSTSAMTSFAQLAGLVGRWCGREDLAHDLVTGLAGIYAAEMGPQLWQIAQALRNVGLDRLVVDSLPHVALAHLRETPAARPAIDLLHAFLDRHGHRCPHELEWLNPRWIEAPEQIVELVAGYLRAGERANPLPAAARARARREAAASLLEGRLDPVRRAIFRRLLAGVQDGVRRRDNGRNYVMKVALPRRQLYAELGRRWADRGWLAQPEDIFFLVIPEIEAVVTAGDPAPAGLDLQTAVTQRRRAHEYWFSVEPPAVLGPAGRPLDDGSAPTAAAELSPELVLRGIAASGGRARGTARIVARLSDISRLQPGDILVTHATDPGWTPVFPLASALVLEAGGQLSHGAIVAREYGVPAVLGVRDATKRIVDGQVLTVDGTTGQVTLEPVA